MSTRQKYDNSNTMTISDALETLSDIVDMEFDRNNPTSSLQKTEGRHREAPTRKVQWMNQHDGKVSLNVIKEIFKIVFHYISNLYERDVVLLPNAETTERLKTIMVLVGEAAKKLDRYSHHVQGIDQSVTDLKEYKFLQEFYRNRIARKIEEHTLSKWIVGLSQNFAERVQSEKREETKHVFVDLEAVRKDTEYELFYIRKEDGTRFFSPRLIRNIKLICDFGKYLENSKNDHFFTDFRVWQDRMYQQSAKNIIYHLGNTIGKFYKATAKVHESELMELISKAVMALMLSGNSHNLLHHEPIKSCMDYFYDFQNFLRKALHTREYEKFIAYPPKKTQLAALSQIEIIQRFCEALWGQLQGLQEMSAGIQELLMASHEKKAAPMLKEFASLSEALHGNYTAMSEYFRRYSSGPLVNVLNSIDEGTYHTFDPVMQHNIPNQLYSLYVDDRKITNMRMPVPITQEFIHKAAVNEEFRNLLHAKDATKGSLLLINLQDRTSWKEHARCVALEELQNHFSKDLVVVTLPKDTEFYHQEAPYDHDNHVDAFLQHFKEHLEDESSGFFFPGHIKKMLFPKFIETLLHKIHKVFFGGKNVLLREARCNFIEIFYLFLELKLIELVKPSSISLLCKDGIDVGLTASSELFAFLKLIQDTPMSEREFEQLNLILYAPAVLMRQRVVLADRFQRLQSVVKEIEGVKNLYGEVKFANLIEKEFGCLYKSSVLRAHTSFPDKY